MSRHPLSRRRFLRGATLAASTLAVPSLLAACGDDDDEGSASPAGGTATTTASGDSAPAGKLIVGVSSYFETEHFNKALSRPPSYNEFIANRIFRGLTYLDATDGYKVRPEMAESIDVSTDGLTYTAKLRKDITWHDGKPFTADDVKFTYDMVMDPANKAGSRSDLGPLDTVMVTDPQTVTFTLAGPFAPFMVALALDIMPKHILEGQDLLGGEFAQGKPIGTGPYKFKEWRRTEFIELEHNPDFYGTKPKIAGIVVRYFADPAGALAAARSGEVHAAELTEAQIASMGNTDKFKTATVKSVSPNSIAFNFKQAIFADPRPRIAMNYAVDRKAIMDAIYAGGGTAASGPFPNSPYDDPSLPPFTLDQGQVQKLMTEAGWALQSGTWTKDGKPFKFTIFAPGFFADGGQLAADQLKKAGFDVNVDATKDYAYVFSNLDTVQAMTYNFGSPADPDSTYLALHSSASIDKGGYTVFYNNPAVDRALDRGRAGGTEAERMAAYKDVQAEVRKDPPYLFIVAQDYLSVLDTRVTGWKEGVSGLGFSQLAANFESWSLAT